jgi:glutaconate CoA-transferase subunit A
VIRKCPDRTIIPWFNVDAVVHAPYGSWPGEMAGMYERDEAHYRSFIDQTQKREGADAYLKEWVYDLPNHRALLDKIGGARLAALRIDGKGA